MRPLKNQTANGLPFDKMYWDDMYAEDDESIIDGVYNAENHAKYVYELFQLFEISVKSLGDMGFGLGVLLREFAMRFKPKQIVAVDPSDESINNLLNKKWHKSFNIAIQKSTIEDFNISYLSENPLDLLICNSVIQYIPNKNMILIFEKLSKICKYLYISIPTDEDYKYMKEYLNFSDPYAYSRKKKFYLNSWNKYFSIVSHNLLESKFHVAESPFLFELFRF